MEEHPPTSIDIDPERQYDESTLDSSRSGSLKSSVVTPQNIYKSVLPSSDTTTLQKNPNMKNPKKSPNKEYNTKIDNVTQYF